MAEDQGLYEKYGLEIKVIHARVWEEVPYVKRESVQAILDVYPKDAVKGMPPEKIIDHSPLKELEDSGFIRDLYLK